jgi:hypothetical protein
MGWIRVLRFGLRKKLIPYPGSGYRGQKSSGSKILDPDPQHRYNISETL